MAFFCYVFKDVPANQESVVLRAFSSRAFAFMSDQADDPVSILHEGICMVH